MRKYRKHLKSQILRRVIPKFLWDIYHAANQNSDVKFQIGVASIKAQRGYYQEFHDLRQSEVRVFSQNGEDGVLDFIFEKCKLIKPSILEIGVGNFSECNSKFANFFRGSGVYLVDASPDLNRVYEDYRKCRTNTLFFYEQTWIDTTNAREIFERAKSKLGKLDVLSIDIDGNDYWVLKQIPVDEFEVVVVEYNPSLSHSKPVSVVYDPKFDRTKKHFSWKYYGATLEAFIHFFDNRDFKFIGATSQGTNAFFVKSKYYKVFRAISKNANDYKNLDSREARNQQGELSFLDYESELKMLKDFPFIDVRN